MSAQSIITLYTTYKNLYPTSELILLHNCSTQLKKLLKKHDYLKTHIAVNNMFVFEYNTNIFLTQNALYRFIVNSIQPEYLYSFTHARINNGEVYNIIHKNIQAAVLIHNANITFTVAMENINIEKYINKYDLNNPLTIYIFVTNYIDKYILQVVRADDIMQVD